MKLAETWRNQFGGNSAFVRMVHIRSKWDNNIDERGNQVLDLLLTRQKQRYFVDDAHFSENEIANAGNIPNG